MTERDAFDTRPTAEEMLERVRAELEECIQNKLAAQGVAYD